MYEIDQSKRFYLKQIDSIYKLSNFSFVNMKRKKEILGSRFEKYKISVDSNWVVIKQCDLLNTKKLIEITNKFGFPNNKRLGVYKSKAYMIFVHSPPQFFDEIRFIINEEYNKKRISEYKKEYIFWHLNGRKGMPPRSGKDGKAVRL